MARPNPDPAVAQTPGFSVCQSLASRLHSHRGDLLVGALVTKIGVEKDLGPPTPAALATRAGRAIPATKAVVRSLAVRCPTSPASIARRSFP